MGTLLRNGGGLCSSRSDWRELCLQELALLKAIDETSPLVERHLHDVPAHPAQQPDPQLWNAMPLNPWGGKFPACEAAAGQRENVLGMGHFHRCAPLRHGQADVKRRQTVKHCQPCRRRSPSLAHEGPVFEQPRQGIVHAPVVGHQGSSTPSSTGPCAHAAALARGGRSLAAGLLRQSGEARSRHRRAEVLRRQSEFQACGRHDEPEFTQDLGIHVAVDAWQQRREPTRKEHPPGNGNVGSDTA
mmetsp:Transcript_34790/g.95959  ORF Transcript_34790/g.95959 Transcript_34790/m.95959 type:complete len:244 (-) Transcript_34790:2028-2759(-)